MAVKRITIDCVKIEDEPGSLQRLLASAAEAGVDLLCFAAFGAGRGHGHVYLSAKNHKVFRACAEEAGIDTKDAAGFMIQGSDRPGAAAKVLKKLADAGINGVAGAAMVCDGQYQMLIVVDARDGGEAEKALGK